MTASTASTVSAPFHTKALAPGTTLREWRLDGLLGSGGFGIVYRGTGVYFNDTVAIKEYFPSAISERVDGVTVTPTDASSEELYRHGLQKFLEEAKILWNLSRPERHPNIVCVRSLFEIHGTAYMVMDFEQGVSLADLLREGRRFDERSLLSVIRPVAEGLARAHGSGVYHRDIKPANILIADEGRPVLIDFGSARFETGQATSTKVTFYTPPYAALEQYVRTFPQGPWTDIYALGVTMYQCITGEKPPEVLERLHGGAQAPLAARVLPGYSPAFLAAVDTAMAIKPEDRPQSLGAWLRLLDPTYIAPESMPSDEATRIAARDSGGATTVVSNPTGWTNNLAVGEGAAVALPDGGVAILSEKPEGKKRRGKYGRRGGWRSISLGSIVFNLLLLGAAIVVSNSLLKALEQRVDWPIVAQARVFTDAVIAAGREGFERGGTVAGQWLEQGTQFIQQKTADGETAPPVASETSPPPASVPPAESKPASTTPSRPPAGPAKPASNP
jgi:serine/threonine protein kinase